MKAQLFILPALLVAPIASGATFLVDLNTNTTGGPGGTWNALDSGDILTAGTALVDSSNGSGPVTLKKSTGTIDHSSQGNSIYNPSTPAENPTWASAVGSNGAAGDYIYTTSAYTLTFGGLLAGSAVSLDVLASRDLDSAVGNFDYSLDGGSTWLGFTVYDPNGTAATGIWDGKNTAAYDLTLNPNGLAFSLDTQGHGLHRYMSMDNTLAPGVTTLLVRTTKSDAYTGMNALRLTATPVPEPSAAALLLLGAVGLVSRHRR